MTAAAQLIALNDLGRHEIQIGFGSDIVSLATSPQLKVLETEAGRLKANYPGSFMEAVPAR